MYPDREDYLNCMGDACGEAQELVVNDFLEGIQKTLRELKPLLDEDSYSVVIEKFKKDFGVKI